MQKKHVLIVILILTIFLLGCILLFTKSTRINRVVVSEEKWHEIQRERTENDKISLKNISFNDYPLIIDEENSKLYYAFVDNTKKYNPTMKYVGNEKQTKIYLKEEITEKTVNDNNPIEVMVFNNNHYHVYQLWITKNPIINIRYNKMVSETARGEILVVDNQVKSKQKVIKTDASITKIDNQDYTISMRIKSIGRNDRENDISLFGITPDHEFMLKKDLDDSSKIKIDVFENNQYQGEYQLDYKENRGETNEK